MNLQELEIAAWKEKARKWDELEQRISDCYGHLDEEGEWVENKDDDIDLGTIGEIAATAFGYL